MVLYASSKTCPFIMGSFLAATCRSSAIHRVLLDFLIDLVPLMGPTFFVQHFWSLNVSNSVSYTSCSDVTEAFWPTCSVCSSQPPSSCSASSPWVTCVVSGRGFLTPSASLPPPFAWSWSAHASHPASQRVTADFWWLYWASQSNLEWFVVSLSPSLWLASSDSLRFSAALLASALY